MLIEEFKKFIPFPNRIKAVILILPWPAAAATHGSTQSDRIHSTTRSTVGYRSRRLCLLLLIPSDIDMTFVLTDFLEFIKLMQLKRRGIAIIMETWWLNLVLLLYNNATTLLLYDWNVCLSRISSIEEISIQRHWGLSLHHKRMGTGGGGGDGGGCGSRHVSFKSINSPCLSNVTARNLLGPVCVCMCAPTSPSRQPHTAAFLWLSILAVQIRTGCLQLSDAHSPNRTTTGSKIREGYQLL